MSIADSPKEELYDSRITDEVRPVYEINSGKISDNIKLLLDTELSLNSNRVYDSP